MGSENSFSQNSLQNRLSALRPKERGKAVRIEDPIDLFYLTGLKLSAGELLLCKEETILFVDGRYLEAASEAPCPAVLSSKEQKNEFFKRNEIVEALFDGAKISFEQGSLLGSAYPGVVWSSVPYLTKSLRIVKDPGEIAALQTSCAFVQRAFARLQTLLRPGITERELAAQCTVFCAEEGADSLSFEPIIAFGPNSAKPHHRAGARALKEGDPVLIDIGVCVGGYHSDMTRTLFFGRKDPELSRLFDIVTEAYEAALDQCKPGIPCKNSDVAARKVFHKYGTEEYFVHSLGHGVGLEVHEFPKIRFDAKEGDTVFTPGTVFTIEPGLYLPGKGGIRYENTLLIQEDGALSLT